MPATSANSPTDLTQRCQPIELILCDVDGVLTDGRIVVDNQGIESKQFHIRDGMGIRLWQKAGYRFGLVTARNSHVVRLRAAELGIAILRQGVEDKLIVLREVLRHCGLSAHQACYIGDDLPDLAAVCNAGLGVAVADACGELRARAHYVTAAAGGNGAVRETIELVLKAQGRWEDLLRLYLEGPNLPEDEPCPGAGPIA